MFVVAIFLFLIAGALSFVEEYLPARTKLFVLAGMAFVMIVLPTVKDISTTADAENYVNYFMNNDDPLIELMTEPTFIYLARLLLAIGADIIVLFFIYAIITVPTKLTALFKLTPFIFTALMIYIPVYYLMQEVVQIRAGAAAAFLLVSLYLTCEKKYIWATVALITGTLFHYSCIVFLPVLIWGNRPLNITMRCILALMVPFGFIMYFKGIDLLSFLPSSLTEGKVDFYKESAETGDMWSDYILPYKNLYLLMKCALLWLSLLYYETIKAYNKYVDSCLVMLGASIFINLSMATIPVIAGRIGDLYGITDAITFSFCLYYIRPAWVVKCVIAFVGLYMLMFNYVHAGFVV